MKTTKGKMTVLVTVFVIAAVLLLMNWQTDAEAASVKKGKGCKLQGSWYGITPFGASYLATYHGTGANEGTSDLEWIDLDPMLPSFGLGAVSASSARGVWAKTGPDTFDFTLLTYLRDSDGQIVLVMRTSGTKTMLDCNTMEVISGDAEFLSPGMNPLEGGRSCSPPPIETEITIARRIILEQPCDD